MIGGKAITDDACSGLLSLSDGPHLRSGDSVPKIVLTVIIALLPAAAYSVYLFGFAALIMICVSVVSALCADILAGFALRKRVDLHDGSAVITGLLLAMSLPPLAPWWMGAVGSFVAIVLAKQLFGGLGCNIFNPALAGRAFLAVSWPEHLSRFWFYSGGAFTGTESAHPGGFSTIVYDVITQAAPLASVGDGRLAAAGAASLQDPVLARTALKSLMIGNTGGWIGEVSALLLLAGAIFLLIRKIITWHIPAAFIGTAAACLAAFHVVTGAAEPLWPVLLSIFSGGIILGAFFMATDTVTSPVTPRGMILFGAGCGLITFFIRTVAGRPDGVCYAILIMNALVPLIDRYVRPRIFGSSWKKKDKGAQS